MRVGHCAICPSDRLYLEGKKTCRQFLENLQLFTDLPHFQLCVKDRSLMRRSSPHSQKTPHRKRGLKGISKQTERFSHVSSSATWGVSLVNYSALRQNAKSTHTAKLKEQSISRGTKTQHSPVIPIGLCRHIFLNAVKLVEHATAEDKRKISVRQKIKEDRYQVSLFSLAACLCWTVTKSRTLEVVSKLCVFRIFFIRKNTLIQQPKPLLVLLKKNAFTTVFVFIFHHTYIHGGDITYMDYVTASDNCSRVTI